MSVLQADAEINLSSTTRDRQKLIVKGEEIIDTKAVEQSNIEGIHKTLTQFYRGMNEYNVDRMVKASLSVSLEERQSVSKMFDRLKSDGVDISVEIKNIELVSFSGNMATVNIDQLLTIRKFNRSANARQFAAVELVKNRGRWRVSRSNTILQSLERR